MNLLGAVEAVEVALNPLWRLPEITGDPERTGGRKR
jgi:hypothetical protein